MENPTLNLNIVKTETAPCTLALKVEVLPPRVQKTFGEVIAMFSKQVKIPGFRSGKVPTNVILKRFGSDVTAETRKRLIGAAYEDAIKAENLYVLGEPELKETDENVSKDTSFFVSFEVEVMPTLTLPNYKGLKLTRKAVVIEDKQIDEALASLQERNTKYDKSDNPAAANDMVRADYTATVPEGVEITDKSKFILNGTNSWLVLKEPEMLPGMTAALVGAKVGDERDVTITFPETHYNSEVAGKSFSYHVKINEIHTATVPALDDELAKTVGCDTLEQLRTRIADNMKQQGENAEHSSLCHQVEEFFKNAMDFELPPKLLEAEKNAIAAQNYQAELRRGVSKEELEPKKDEMLASAEAEAANRIRLEMTLEAIANVEKVEVTQEELLQTINQYAMMQGMKLDEMIRKLQKENRIRTMMASLRMQKTLDAIVKLAEVTETK